MSPIKSIKTEMTAVLVDIPLTPIFVEDKNVGGFTAYFKEFPEIVTQGETTEDAIQNLRNTIYDVFKYKNTLPE
jgi:hypothetical protein